MSPPILARTRRSDLVLQVVADHQPERDDNTEDESLDWSNQWSLYDIMLYDIFPTNIIVENSFQVAPISEPEIRMNEWELEYLNSKYFSVSDQILYLNNRNLIVLDYENNTP